MCKFILSIQMFSVGCSICYKLGFYTAGIDLKVAFIHNKILSMAILFTISLILLLILLAILSTLKHKTNNNRIFDAFSLQNSIKLFK